jgi:dTMP kinase
VAPAGSFVVFEGGEGAGKSTVIAAVAEHFRSRGRKVVTTREPGGTPTAEAIRSVLLTPTDAPMSDRCEALLFAAARADHVAHVIRPSLEVGALVLSDRFVDSSLAYQGFARGLDVDEVRQLSRWACDGMQPDLTIVLDLDPAVGLARAKDGNRMEDQGIHFHHQVRAGLLELAAEAPERYVVVDASDALDAVVAASLAAVAAVGSR